MGLRSDREVAAAKQRAYSNGRQAIRAELRDAGRVYLCPDCEREFGFIGDNPPISVCPWCESEEVGRDGS